MATTMPAFAARIFSRYFPLVSIALPKELSRISYSMVWSKRQHSAASHIWLRNRIVDIIGQEHQGGRAGAARIA